MENHYFTCEEVRPGVYAAIVKEGMGALGNAGFVNLGEATLVFDTFALPQAAAELRATAESLTGNPVKYAVNSHFHGDHTNGNQLFRDSVIISTPKTREKMAETFAEMSRAERKSALILSLQKTEEQLAKTESDQLRRSLEIQRSDQRRLWEAIDLLEQTLPTLLIEDKLVLECSRRRVELHHFGCGHTCSDLLMYVPEEKILFAGDLVLADHHAWMGHGRPEEWLTILDRLAPFEIDTVIPGHGPAGKREQIDKMKTYLNDMMSVVSDNKRKGLTADEILCRPIPLKHAHLNSAHMYERNVRFLYDYVEQGLISQA
ncbi:MBL fold metallo-hydrolase [Bacillus sp. FJAT-42376]|uniref:MBL fold metallo-hydrolase n=1 Tax=Bacillus sp. FJAT-42376 TaxID=2014076 RepID=UPI000F4ECAD2|nr:MBL fold metallo-hydrolase [Bacillus sp. FJAT-42376]AZB41801.1 MBL fold metallo-hydrolase [Bacillus sp. FJAT-42376]